MERIYRLRLSESDIDEKKQQGKEYYSLCPIVLIFQMIYRY